MLRSLSRYDHLVPLLLRLGAGLTFLLAGYGKVTGNMAGLSGSFGGMGIPAPQVMAPFIAYLELLGGIALLLGLATRLAGLLFMGEMAVATALSKWPAVIENGGFRFAEMRTEWMLMLACLALAFGGAGKYALDARLFKDQVTPTSKSM